MAIVFAVIRTTRRHKLTFLSKKALSNLIIVTHDTAMKARSDLLMCNKKILDSLIQIMTGYESIPTIDYNSYLG